MNKDDRPPEDADYPRQSSIVVPWSPSEDVAAEIIEQGQRICEESEGGRDFSCTHNVK